MRAITIDAVSQRLREVTVPVPSPQKGEVLIRISYAGVNHADLFQVKGSYPLPEGTHPIPGLEVSGIIDAIGEGVTSFQPREKVCALLSEGGYAEYVTANAGLCFHLPETETLARGAALPEALATGWHALFNLANLRAGEHAFISGGASGVGSIALQLALCKGAVIYTAASTPEKAAYCESLGAHVISPGRAALVEYAQHTSMDVILDMAGGEMIGAYLKLLRYGGRLISIACMEEAKTSISLSGVLMKNLCWRGMTLRSQPVETKAHIIQAIRSLYDKALPPTIHPRIDRIFPFAQADEAHTYMASRQHIGKIVLAV